MQGGKLRNQSVLLWTL